MQEHSSSASGGDQVRSCGHGRKIACHSQLLSHDGTALALYLGHRSSVYLDFFSAEAFPGDTLIQSLQATIDLAVVSKSPQTVYPHVSGTDVSFIGYRYFQLFPLTEFRGVAVADVLSVQVQTAGGAVKPWRAEERTWLIVFRGSDRYSRSETIEVNKRFPTVSWGGHADLEINSLRTPQIQRREPPHLADLRWKKRRHLRCRCFGRHRCRHRC